MTKQDKENLIKEIDVEIAYQENIIYNNQELLKRIDSGEELSFDRDLYGTSIFSAHNVITGLEIAKTIILNAEVN